MRTFQDQEFTGAAVELDDAYFVNCRFTNCVLIYSGGRLGLENCRLDKCRTSFHGPADLTVRLLTLMGMFKGSQEPTSGTIQ